MTQKTNYVTEKNPAHFCDCGEWLGFRGFCCKKCHDKHYRFFVQSSPEIKEIRKSMERLRRNKG